MRLWRRDQEDVPERELLDPDREREPDPVILAIRAGLTQLTFYRCENPGCDYYRIPMQGREHVTGELLVPEAVVCSCGYPRTRLDDTASPDSVRP